MIGPKYPFVCLNCIHYLHAGKCIAFPDGIPDSIMFEGNDHRKPVEGDHGIQFEQAPSGEENFE
jgi:hypothetical protein